MFSKEEKREYQRGYRAKHPNYGKRNKCFICGEPCSNYKCAGCVKLNKNKKGKVDQWDKKRKRKWNK